MAVSQAPVSSMTRVARSKFITLGSFEVRNPSHFPATLKIDYSGRLPLACFPGSHGAASDHELQKSQAKTSAIFFIYIMLVSFRRFNFFRNSDQVHRRVLVKNSTYL